jgi:GMP synthase-like glutamine amidotransferase
MSTRALVLQHGDWGPPGLLADWAAERDVTLEIHHAASGDPLPPLGDQAFVASLGSPHNPDAAVDEVVAELSFVRDAVARDVPVLGLCFGGQMLAKALGGRIEPAERAEVAWHRIRSSAPDEVPEGPWLQWHYDAFTLPPGAEALADSPAGLQAFRHGRHLGVQFHPESTVEIVREWARTDAPRLAALGIEDGEALLERGRGNADAAKDAAYVLFDAFWKRARS